MMLESDSIQMAFFEKYKILGRKGEGTFGTVVKCQDLETGKFYACKILKKTIKDLNHVYRLREVQAMRNLNYHPNILQLDEIIYDQRKRRLFLICELMSINLYELIRDRTKYLNESRIKNYIYQLLKALDHMHRHGIFHRDVKPENMLISDNHLKLADFGSCRSIKSKRPFTEYISTRWYRSPECLLTNGYYTYKMDIWSAGCVLFELCSLSPLFPGEDEVDQIDRIHGILGTPSTRTLKKFWKYKNKYISFNFPRRQGTGIECIFPPVLSNCLDMVYFLCTYDLDERPTAREALLHPYFKNLREMERNRRNMERWTYSEIPGTHSSISFSKSIKHSKERKNLNSENTNMIVTKSANRKSNEGVLKFRKRQSKIFPKVNKNYRSFSSDNIHESKSSDELQVGRLPHLKLRTNSKKEK